MDSLQKDASNKLSDFIKTSEKYSELTRKGSDIDIYILPAKNGVEARLIDLYSENFIKNKDGTIFSAMIDDNSLLCSFADKIISMYEKVKNNIVERPEPIMADYIHGNTDVAKINPKIRDAEWFYNYYLKLGTRRTDAAIMAFDSHIATVNNSGYDGIF